MVAGIAGSSGPLGSFAEIPAASNTVNEWAQVRTKQLAPEHARRRFSPAPAAAGSTAPLDSLRSLTQLAHVAVGSLH